MSQVVISNTAINMLSSLYPKDRRKVDLAIASVKADVENPDRVKKLDGYTNVFVARGNGLRAIFQRNGDSSVVTSVAAEG